MLKPSEIVMVARRPWDVNHAAARLPRTRRLRPGLMICS